MEETKVKKKSKLRLMILLVILLGLIIFLIFRFTNIGVKLTADSQAEIPTLNADSDSKVLIAYFTAAENSDSDAISSASVTVVNGVAKGNLRSVADRIAEKTGGDLYSIRTDIKYPHSYNKLIDHAKTEQQENQRPKLIDPIPDIGKYDVVFIGYPTWWYDMPQAMYSFFDEYDFSGKTIYLFNSAQGSEFSGTGETVKKFEPDALSVEEGISIYGGKYYEADIDNWLGTIGYR